MQNSQSIAFTIAGVSLILFLAVLGDFQWRSNQRRELMKSFRSAVVVNSDNNMIFNGVAAIIHAQNESRAGVDSEGSDFRMQAQFLCSMPEGGWFKVLVEASSKATRSSTQVTELSEAGFHYWLDRYPFRKGPRRSS